MYKVENVYKDHFVSQGYDFVRKVPREAVRIWTGSDEEDLSHEAFTLLVEMEDLSIVPVLEAPLGNDVETISAAMALVTDQEIRLRDRVLSRLESWLEDKRPLPERCLLNGTENIPSVIRVCDEAYLALTRMTHIGRNEEVLMDKTQSFLTLSESERDSVIDAVRGLKQVG